MDLIGVVCAALRGSARGYRSSRAQLYTFHSSLVFWVSRTTLTSPSLLTIFVRTKHRIECRAPGKDEEHRDEQKRLADMLAALKRNYYANNRWYDDFTSQERMPQGITGVHVKRYADLLEMSDKNLLTRSATKLSSSGVSYDDGFFTCSLCSSSHVALTDDSTPGLRLFPGFCRFLS